MDQATRHYIQELKAVIECDQSDGYLKLWARERLEKINNPVSLIEVPRRELSTVR
jgi:hypothetical protein